MRNIPRRALPGFALAGLLLQGSLSVDAQASNNLALTADLHFISGQSADRIPFDFVGNHIYVRARVNDSGPFWFLFDTGATASYFEVQRAKAIGLGGPDNSIQGVSLDLNGMKVPNQNFFVRPIKFGDYDGRTVDGILGYDFIKRFVVEIDYQNKTLRLYEPQGYKYSGSGEIVPLVMLEDDSGGKVPLVSIKITQQGRAAIEGKFIADTGVRSAITFNTPFGETHQLLQFARKTIQAPLGGGAMVQESKQPVGRVPNMQLGRFTFKNPIAIFFQDKGGIVASPEFDGVIGGESLRRFKVIFDYTRQQVILEPNRRLSEPEEYDMSGTLLITEGADFKTFRVKQIVEGSPASAAGLQAGDIISAIDRKSASSMTLEQVRQMFKQKGREYKLKIRRGERDIEATIKLKRLI